MFSESGLRKPLIPHVSGDDILSTTFLWRGIAALACSPLGMRSSLPAMSLCQLPQLLADQVLSTSMSLPSPEPVLPHDTP